MFFRKKLSFEEFGLRSLRVSALVNLSQSHIPPPGFGTSCVSELKINWCWEEKKKWGSL